MADDIKISVDVDTKRGVANLDNLGDASADAGKQLGKLEDQARTTDADVTIDIDIDKAKFRGASDALEDVDRKGRGMADGVGFGNNALRDLTGPLGDSVGPAGDLGDAFEGLGAIAGGLGTKLGLGEAAVSKLSGAVAGIGVVVAAGVAAWSLYKAAQEKAAEAAKKLFDIQVKIRDGKLEDAAIDLREAYAGTIQAMEDLGLEAGDLLPILLGQGDALDTLRTRYTKLKDAADASFTGAIGASEDGAEAAQAQADAVGRLVDNLTTARDAWATNGQAIVNNDRVLDELKSSLGATAEGFDITAEAAATAAGKVDEITTAFQKLKGELGALDSIEGVLDAFDSIDAAALDAWNAALENTPDAAAKMRDYEQAARDAIGTVLGLEGQIEGLTPEEITEIGVAVQDGDLAKARELLGAVADGLPPVKINLDTAYLAAQLDAFYRNFTPTARPAGAAAAAGGGGPVNPEGDRRTPTVTNVTNYYPAVVDPFAANQAAGAYKRMFQ